MVQNFLVSEPEGVKFVTDLRERLKLKRYSFAKLLGIPTQQLDYIEDKGEGIKLGLLCKIRKVTGLSWSELGKIIEREFEEKP